ncbi:hypothetical protein N7539_006137 [Penicillium diatomitis]|uniref:N-acetyltransferase domain-containing protein n=1 Tax=Penicillium diatomitis TaxID=2819901 RepID=A0A9W9X2H0_9EURO|nr:uncharacterized protein N7539_006137 [Penicillium diatomitis]KAJ5482691.1 hypothetical protein N7539_006137 [Penicillium diatomitis]
MCFRWPKVPHKDIAESERTITEKVFKTPDATGKIGRQFYFAIIRKDDPHQKVIGAVGINFLDPAPSLGYGIHPDCWGKGFAGEAARAVVNAWWQLDRMGSDKAGKERLYAACNQANIASVKVLLRAGFRKVKEISIEGDTVAVFDQTRPC